jgi:hypothetical protein
MSAMKVMFSSKMNGHLSSWSPLWHSLMAIGVLWQWCMLHSKFFG